MLKLISIFRIVFVYILCLVFLGPREVFSGSEPEKESTLHEKPSEAPGTVTVKPKIRDEEIAERLENILQATNWFIAPAVVVENGVVFLSGEAKSEQLKVWAGDLARNTQDVVAVVNKITVLVPSVWDSSIILQGFLNQRDKIIRSLPGIISGVIILIFSWIFARLVYKLLPLFFRDKQHSSLVNQVVARMIAFFVFLMGVYFVCEVTDLTTLAVTIISGTGIVGIILGIAFHDLAENFLASILLSLQNPFRTHDWIDIVCPVTGYVVTGCVERLTMRATVLTSSEGDHMQIPNATVYKSNIVNRSSSPIHKETFPLRIGSNISLVKAIDCVKQVLVHNVDVLSKPEPLVLVKELAKESIQLQVCYWIDINSSNADRLKSIILQAVQQALVATSQDLCDKPP